MKFVISIVNIVNVAAHSGKTTIAVNLAAEFAERGWRTLLIDADPQARATSFFLKPDKVVGTLSDILLPTTQRLTEITTDVWDVFSPPSLPYLCVVASDIRLATIEDREPSHATIISDRIKSISKFYDLVILDTPSSLALLTQACLLASTHALVPVSAGRQDEEGLHLVYEYLCRTPDGNAQPKLSVVSNLFNCRDHSSGLLDERLRAAWGMQVLDTIIHRDVQVETCTERQQTLRAFSPKSAAANLYANLAGEFLTSINLTSTGRETSARWQ